MNSCDVLYQIPTLLQEVNKGLNGEKTKMLKVSKGLCKVFDEEIKKGVVILLSGKAVFDVFLVDDVSEFMKKVKSFGSIKSLYMVFYDFEIEAYKVVYEYLNFILKETK